MANVSHIYQTGRSGVMAAGAGDIPMASHYSIDAAASYITTRLGADSWVADLAVPAGALMDDFPVCCPSVYEDSRKSRSPSVYGPGRSVVSAAR